MSSPIAVLTPFLESDPFANLTATGVWSMAYVILVACLFGYWAWFSIVRLVPTAVASIAVLPVPLVGVMSSALALGEPIGWPEIGALLFHHRRPRHLAADAKTSVVETASRRRSSLAP